MRYFNIKRLKIIKTFSELYALINLCKNWYICFFDYLKFYIGLPTSDDVLYILRNGVKLKGVGKNSKESSDIGTIRLIWINKSYTPSFFDIRKDYNIIDIGAHKGYFSIFAASQATEVNVYSFEPFLDNFNTLLENIKLNNLNNKINPFNLGVSGERSKKKLYLSEDKHHGDSSIYGKGDKFVEISCITLEDVFRISELEKCDFLKMDCEGSEYEILFKTTDEILMKIRKISLEIHYIPGYNPDQLSQFLKEKGFSVIDSDEYIYAERL